MKKITKININTKSPKLSTAAQFWVCRVKQEWRVMGGGVEVAVVVGSCIHKHKPGDGGRCWGGVDEVAVVVGSCVRKHKPGEGAWG